MEKLLYKDCVIIGTTKYFYLNQQCGISAKDINDKDLMLVVVEMIARKLVRRREFWRYGVR